MAVARLTKAPVAKMLLNSTANTLSKRVAAIASPLSSSLAISATRAYSSARTSNYWSITYAKRGSHSSNSSIRTLTTSARLNDVQVTSGTLQSPSELARKLSEAALPRIPRPDVKKVLVVGSGGLSIGQAGEFDYSGESRQYLSITH